MSDPHRSKLDRRAADAAKALDRAHRQGLQLGLFGDPEPSEDRKRDRNKTQSKVSQWLHANGYGSPIEAMARHAGLHIQGDAAIKAMAMADALETWATRGECDEDGTVLRFSPETRKDIALAIMAEQRKAGEALAQYTAKRLSPDVKVDARTQQVAFVLGGGSGAGQGYAPPPLPENKAMQNQQVIDVAPSQSDKGESDK